MQAIEMKCDSCKKENGIIVTPDGIDAGTLRQILQALDTVIQCQNCSFVAKSKKRNGEIVETKKTK